MYTVVKYGRRYWAVLAPTEELLGELILVEEGWAARERGHGDRLNPWEKERLGFIRAAIAQAKQI